MGVCRGQQDAGAAAFLARALWHPQVPGGFRLVSQGATGSAGRGRSRGRCRSTCSSPSASSRCSSPSRTARAQDEADTVFGRDVDLGFDPVTKPVDPGTLIIDLGLLQVDLLVGERNKVTMLQ